MPAPHGGRYLFVWSFNRWMNAAHLPSPKITTAGHDHDTPAQGSRSPHMSAAHADSEPHVSRSDRDDIVQCRFRRGADPSLTGS